MMCFYSSGIKFETGKKHFFQQASSVLMLCHSLLCSQDVTGFELPDGVRMSLIFEGAGLEFTHQASRLHMCFNCDVM
jgi:hypothetical protein